MEPEKTEVTTEKVIEKPQNSKANMLSLAAFAVLAIAGGILYVVHDGSSAKATVAASKGSSTTTGTTTTASQGAATGSAAPSEGQPAPDFTLLDTSGNTVSLADYKGTPTLIVFEATWCTFCKRENPELERFVKDHEGKVQVVSIDLREDANTVSETWKVRGNSRLVVLDTDGEVSLKYGATGTPTHVFIKPDQTVGYYRAGQMTYDQLVAGAAAII